MTPDREKPDRRYEDEAVKLPRGSGDLASLRALAAFTRLFTAGCLEIRGHSRPLLFRLIDGIDASLLDPEERIVAQCAGSFIGEILEALLPKAEKRIREAMPESGRAATPDESRAFEEARKAAKEALRTPIEEALRYEPPESSCSV